MFYRHVGVLGFLVAVWVYTYELVIMAETKAEDKKSLTVTSKGLKFQIPNYNMNEKYIIPEVSNNAEWYLLTNRKSFITKEEENKIRSRVPSLSEVQDRQVLLIDVFNHWSGPCLAMESHLRRMRHAFREAPEVLKLARVCCDGIDELQPFLQDIRPTFLFWTQGQPVALLRGANRPLLTRLIIQEVEMLLCSNERRVDVDYTSEKVIQCTGDLAQLAYDSVVDSIGNGSTDKLSNLLAGCDITNPVVDDTNEESTHPQVPQLDFEENDDIQDVDPEDGQPIDASASEEIEFMEQEMSANEAEAEDYYDEEDEITDRVELEMVPQNDANGAVSMGPDIEIEESPFGKKVRRRKKKMETRLLKEILFDVGKSSKRFC